MSDFPSSGKLIWKSVGYIDSPLPVSSEIDEYTPQSSSDGAILAPSRWINPRLPTAMTIPSSRKAGVVGSDVSLSHRSKPPLRKQRFLHRHGQPPIPTTSTDPYWIRGSLQPFTADDISDDEADLSYLSDGLACGVEETEESESEVVPNFISENSIEQSESEVILNSVPEKIEG